MKSDIFLSIIVPVYNTPIEHLNRCMDSLKHQTCKDFKVIAVDDGSLAPVREYLDKLQDSWDSLKVFHVEHAGVSAARNYGISHAETPYIAFSDSDDEYSDKFVCEAKEYVHEYNADMVMGVLDYPSVDMMRQTDAKVHFYDSPEAVNEVYEIFTRIAGNTGGLMLQNSPCARVYDTNLARQAMFDERVLLGEDYLFNRMCLKKAQRVLLVPNIWYTYYSNEYSATHINHDCFWSNRESYYDALYRLYKAESIEMQQLLCIPHYREIFDVISIEILENQKNGKGKTRRLETRKIMGRALSHPLFKEVFGILGSRRDISAVDKVFVYLVNHRRYECLIFCCKTVRILKHLKRRLHL